MSAGPGVSNIASIVAGEGRAREITGGAKVAAVLVAIAPWMAALAGAGQTFRLLNELESAPLERLTYWGLVGTALACAFFISRHLWRGVHDGGIAPVRLLLLSTLPLWLPAEAVGQFLAQYLLRAGNPWGFAEASMLRIAGQYLAWGLTGSVVLGLTISAFLWRAPARRLPGVAWAWASLAPIALFVAWVVGTAQVQSLELRSNLVAYAWVSLPFVLGFAGAALGDAPRAHPRPDWILGVGLGALIVFISAASMATGYALIEAQLAQDGYQDAASADAIARAGRVAWLGLPLATLPLFGFALRLQQWPSAAGWGMTLLPIALLAIALLVDAAGPGAEHGLAEAYPRRLWLLVAYAVLVPLAILALRRQIGGGDALRDGLTLATALAGLMCLAWRPGLLLLAPPARESTALESSAPAPPDVAPVGAPPPPPPPPPPPEFVGSVEGGVEAGVEGGVTGGLPAGVPGPTPDSAPTLPVTARIVQPDVLKGLRISGAEVLPPPDLYAGAPRMAVTVALLVDAGGSVTRVEVLRSSGNPELDDYVRSSLRSWRFRPWMEQGRAAPIKSTLTFIFVNQP